MENFIDNNYYSIVYSTFFALTVVFSFLINSLFLKFSRTLGIRNNYDGTIIRWGALSKPAMGGISFYIVFLISVASYSFFFNPKHVLHNAQFVGLLLSMALGFLIGLADDAYNTRPLLKFFVQLSCSAILIISGIYIDLFSNVILNYAITVFWVVGIMNSINLLDNMDSITTIVSIAIVEASMLIILMNRDFTNIHLIILVGVLSSLIAFLYYNWNPSKMYMGDTGSQFLGVFLAYMGIIYFWNDPYPVTPHSPTRQLTIAMLAFIMPIIDTTVVVINRISLGNSPFIGGKDHTTHSLVYMGLSDKMVAVVFMLISFVSVLLIFVIRNYLLNWSYTIFWVFMAYFFSMLAFFFYCTRSKKARNTLAMKNNLSTTSA